MILDIAIGFALGVFAFLVVKGYNIMPIGFLLLGAFLIWKFVIQRQVVGGTGRGVVISTTSVDFSDIGGQSSAKKEL
ncbi:MAG: ATPase, partial [Desulfitobacterium hafniense]|nr:ATPase [Desulfitobacterium hafniense]